ncbi:CHAP domain-containing protein [Caballeronia sp. LjRoot29]|uniref:CHAP domain-containing protein n=1 Tax=Caballeronia sp. LjRoot29 TaxID=3342315 RepID=UPI003ECE7625
MNRRTFLATSVLPLVAAFPTLAQSDEESEIIGLTWPPLELLNPDDKNHKNEQFGYNKPTEDQKKKANLMLQKAPKGPHAIDVAQYFVTTYYESDPESISQWPAPANWNPLIVDFFDATDTKGTTDMIAWCSAFVNWCLRQNGALRSNNASSQSFLKKPFARTTDPKVGDLAVFTCYNLAGQDMGLGHVAFVKTPPADGRVLLLGGNMSSGGHGSIICQETFSVGSFATSRTVGNKRVPCTMRLNAYIQVV